MSKISIETINLLKHQSRAVQNIKSHCHMERNLSDGIIISQFSSSYYPSKTSVSVYQSSFGILRVNPTLPILDVYNMIFLQDRSWHVEITTQNATYHKEATDINLFINTLFDQIKIADTLRMATTMTLKEGLCFLHYYILPDGKPVIEPISSINCNWDHSGTYLPTNMSRSCSYFAFQKLMPFSSIKILYNRPYLQWYPNSNSVPSFNTMLFSRNVSNSSSTGDDEIEINNQSLPVDNRLCVITTLYERTSDGIFKQSIIFNGEEVIHQELFQWMPIIPLYMAQALELKIDGVYAPRTITSPIRQLLVTINEIESSIYRYIQGHFPVRILNSQVVDASTNQSLEDKPDFNINENLRYKILKTNSLQPADQAFSILYPPNLDPSLQQQYDYIMNLIYQYSGVTPDLLGETNNGNKQETDSLFKSRNSLAIQRITPLLECCSNAIVMIAFHLIRDLSCPVGISKMRISPNLVKNLLTNSDIDPTDQVYAWDGIIQFLNISNKREYDTISEIQNISLSSLISAGVLDPQIVAEMLPFLNKERVQELYKNNNKEGEQKQAIEAQKASAEADLKRMEIEERAASNEEKNRIQELGILKDLLLKDNTNTTIDQSMMTKIRRRFEKILQE